MVDGEEDGEEDGEYVLEGIAVVVGEEDGNDVDGEDVGEGVGCFDGIIVGVYVNIVGAGDGRGVGDVPANSRSLNVKLSGASPPFATPNNKHTNTLIIISDLYCLLRNAYMCRRNKHPLLFLISQIFDRAMVPWFVSEHKTRILVKRPEHSKFSEFHFLTFCEVNGALYVL